MSGEALPGFKPVTFSRSVASPLLLSFPERENNFNLWWGFSTLTDATSMKPQNKTWCKIFSISNIFASSTHYLRSSLKKCCLFKAKRATFSKRSIRLVCGCLCLSVCLFKTLLGCLSDISSIFQSNMLSNNNNTILGEYIFFVEWPMISHQVLETVH